MCCMEQVNTVVKQESTSTSHQQHINVTVPWKCCVRSVWYCIASLGVAIRPANRSRNKGTCTRANRIASYNNSQRIDQYTCWAKSRKACSNLLLLMLLLLLLLVLLLLFEDEEEDEVSSGGCCMDLARRLSHRVICRYNFYKKQKCVGWKQDGVGEWGWKQGGWMVVGGFGYIGYSW